MKLRPRRERIFMGLCRVLLVGCAIWLCLHYYLKEQERLYLINRLNLPQDSTTQEIHEFIDCTYTPVGITSGELMERVEQLGTFNASPTNAHRDRNGDFMITYEEFVYKRYYSLHGSRVAYIYEPTYGDGDRKIICS